MAPKGNRLHAARGRNCYACATCPDLAVGADVLFYMEQQMHLHSGLLFGSLFIVPIADDVPTFDVAASCRAAVTASAGIVDSQSYASCMKEENDTREQLRQSWQSFSASNRQNCTAEASSAGTASYVDLIVCLQIARDGKPDSVIQLVKGARKKRS